MLRLCCGLNDIDTVVLVEGDRGEAVTLPL